MPLPHLGNNTDGSKKIGYSAFSDCKSLTSITIPSSVSSIAANAFHTCPSLTSITIPESVSSIAANAFFGCAKLTIYAEATSKPTNWDYYDSSYSWNYSKCPVLWGCNIGLDNVVDANGQAYVVSFSKLSGKIENPNGETLQVPFRKGYIFEGWYENDSFTGTMHTANGIKNAPDGKYYAKWGIASGQESSSESSEIQTKIYCIFENARNKILQAPLRKGYSFGGWYTNSSFTGTMYTTGEIANAPDGIYYAKWNVAV